MSRKERRPAPSQLAEALKDGIHVRGDRNAFGFSGTQKAYDLIADGADDYAKSFERKDE